MNDKKPYLNITCRICGTTARADVHPCLFNPHLPRRNKLCVEVKPSPKFRLVTEVLSAASTSSNQKKRTVIKVATKKDQFKTTPSILSTGIREGE